MSLEGTLAGLLASVLLAFVGCLIGQVLFTLYLTNLYWVISFCLPFVLIYNVPCTHGLQINGPEAVICVIASQIANVGESIIGAALQDKEGFRWVGNHFINFILFYFWGTYVSILFILYRVSLVRWVMDVGFSITLLNY